MSPSEAHLHHIVTFQRTFSFDTKCTRDQLFNDLKTHLNNIGTLRLPIFKGIFNLWSSTWEMRIDDKPRKPKPSNTAAINVMIVIIRSYL